MRIPVILFSILFALYAATVPSCHAATSCHPLFLLDPSGAVGATQPRIDAVNPCTDDSFHVYSPTSAVFGTVVDFAVSSDMQTCAILHLPTRTEWELVVIRLSSGQTVLRTGGSTSTWAWSSEVSYHPSNNQIAVAIRSTALSGVESSVWFVDLAAGGGGAIEADVPLDCAWSPSWSPTGERIAVAHAGGSSVCVLDSQTLSVEHTFYPYGICASRFGCCTQVEWSPDGFSLAFSDSSYVSEGIALGIQGTNGEGSRSYRYDDWTLPGPLCGDSFRVRDFTWSPDSDWIAVLATCFASGDQYVLALSTSSDSVEVLYGPREARWITRLDW